MLPNPSIDLALGLEPEQRFLQEVPPAPNTVAATIREREDAYRKPCRSKRGSRHMTFQQIRIEQQED